MRTRHSCGALGRPTYVKMMNPVASGEKAVREWLLWVVPPHVQEWVPFMTFFFYLRSGESWGAEEKSKGDHLGQLPGSQRKVGNGLLLDRHH